MRMIEEASVKAKRHLPLTRRHSLRGGPGETLVAHIRAGTARLWAQDCYAVHFQDFGQMRLQPVWCIPIHLVLSVAAAMAMHHYVEEPLRKLLRPRARLGGSSRCVCLPTLSLTPNGVVCGDP